MLYPNPHNEGCPWYSFAERFGAPNIKWCEETVCRLISEPVNTWSNLAYVIAGVFLMARNERTTSVFHFGCYVIFVGVMSFVYHASNFFLSQYFDFVGMFALLAFMTFVNMQTLGFRKGQCTAAGIAAFFVPLLAIFPLYLIRVPFQSLVAIGAVLVIVLEIANHKRRNVWSWRFLCALFALGLAAFCSYLDHAGIVCYPEGIFQGHAAWHLLSAISFVFLGMHWESDLILSRNREAG